MLNIQESHVGFKRITTSNKRNRDFIETKKQTKENKNLKTQQYVHLITIFKIVYYHTVLQCPQWSNLQTQVCYRDMIIYLFD